MKESPCEWLLSAWWSADSTMLSILARECGNSWAVGAPKPLLHLKILVGTTARRTTTAYKIVVCRVLGGLTYLLPERILGRMDSYSPGLEEFKYLASNLDYELGTRTRKRMGLGYT